ncbi:class I SAM-dependent methyltransferase [uncultured Nostoc sp.]|uniref:class I SAM-dependent methyltransferase n=1 Tax=uncultured Nostoc sp. TaxID=340711 RepID=UPI0035C98799
MLKLARLAGIQDMFTVGEDKLKEIAFWLGRMNRENQYSAYNQCQNLEEYFEFSNHFFGSHQIKYEIIKFLNFANNEQPKYVCEIGTANGGTNFLLSQALSSTIFMAGIDLYVKNKAQLCYFSKDYQQLFFVDGSSYHPQTVEKVQTILGSKKLDLLFIDGDHSYEGVKQDFLNYRHLVREGGIIVLHDIVPDYYTRYGQQTGRWVGEVPKFWTRIKSHYPYYEFIENPEQDGLGIGAIRYSSKNTLPEDL